VGHAGSVFGAFDAAGYDVDGDMATFGPQEARDIIEIWERVAEDFAPFEARMRWNRILPKEGQVIL
jgi:hypothetical protein